MSEQEKLIAELPTREMVREMTEMLRDENDTCLRWKETVAGWIENYATALEGVMGENSELRLAICGGEDAPGYADSLKLETILGVLRDNYASWRRDSDLAWDGETAQSWKARAERAEAAEVELRSQIAEALEQGRVAGLPETYRWGDDAMSAFNVGKSRTLEAFKAALSTPPAIVGEGLRASCTDIAAAGPSACAATGPRSQSEEG